MRSLNFYTVQSSFTKTLIIFLLSTHLVQAQSFNRETLPAATGQLLKLGQTPVSQRDFSGKLSSDLWQLYRDYQEHLQTNGLVAEFVSNNPAIRVTNASVVIDMAASDSAEALLNDLRSLGMQNPVRYGRVISGRVPISILDELSRLDSLQLARPAYAITHVGQTTTQGDVAMNADDARTLFNVDGSGITIGTLSDSYNCLGGAATDVSNNDLPTGVTVLQDPVSCAGFTDEGRAMMQLIHDVAPGSSQAFHTATDGGMADFANGIMELATVAGADVIVDDVLFFAEPMFQDGIIAQAADSVMAMGVPYFSSAGNSGRNSYESPFDQSGMTVFGTGEAHDFNPAGAVDVFHNINVPVGATLFITLQWDSPFFSVSGAPGSANDLDIFLTDDPPSVGLAASQTLNIGGDAVEVLGFANDGTFGTSFNVVIESISGTMPGLIKYVINGGGSVNEYDTNSSTIYGHANAAGAEAVGAAAYFETPAFGVSPPLLESFSSGGRTPILFNTSGSSVNISRQKPNITCVDGGNTTFFGQDIEPDGFPNFFGTSAAAPHAAAVAALMLNLEPATSPNDIYSILEATAIDMDVAGVDDNTGSGLCQADAAVAALSRDEVTLTASVMPVSVPEPGANVDYTVRIDNTGNTTLSLASLTNSLYGNLIGQGTCSLPQNIAPAGFYECTYPESVSANAGSTVTTITTVTLDSPTSTISDTDTASVMVTDVLPTISFNQVAAPTSVMEPGASASYTLRVDNTSVEPITMTALLDDVNGNLNGQGNCSVPQSVAIGGFYECSFTVMVSGNAGDTVSNTITAVARDDEGNNVQANDTSSVLIQDVLPTTTVSNTPSAMSVNEPGSAVTFTVRVNNTSPEMVTLTSLFDDVFGNLNGQGTCTSPQVIGINGFYECSYTGMISGNGGDSRTNTVTATVNDDETNVAQSSDAATIIVADVLPSIAVTKSASPTKVTTPGGIVTFTVRVDNTSVESITLTSLNDDIHGDVNGQGNCVVPQQIAIGSFYQCAFSAMVSGPAGSSETDTVAASVLDDEMNVATGMDMATVMIVAGPILADLSLQVDDVNDPVLPGEMLEYSILVSNQGPNDAESTVLMATPSPQLTLVSTSGCAEDPAAVPTCTLGTITNGTSRALSFIFSVDDQFIGELSSSFSVTSVTDEANPGDESATEGTIVQDPDVVLDDGFENLD